ncbi:FtsX-like permease family protein [Siphonobacter sp. SORGH_AS_0500]|uniref:FtsX-like permease family protein n=1 Tax=Siphonobacter sp. SORGH_AS_0500 TaxID=1864824 RepID=UPI00285AE335|nr:FtsX-like permease family protein [Siphonobacter sp. SORGH_AS_0500]MDR6194320.1 lipoprotein-releasing system permease protein [Siphonobacter sp. SORGH_AS_0500]
MFLISPVGNPDRTDRFIDYYFWSSGMNLPLLIARRYFLSKKKTSYINLIAIISMLGVCIGTMALVVVLSVFNGLEDFNRQLFKTLDSDLRIIPAKGKSFTVSDSLWTNLKKIQGIEHITQVYEENALVQYQDHRTVATIKAVDDNLSTHPEMDTTRIAGSLQLQSQHQNFAVLGVGVARMLGVSPEDPLTALEIWYPRKNANLAAPGLEAFNEATIQPGGIFSIEQSIDDHYIFVPLRFAEDLFETEGKRTALEFKVKPGLDVEPIQGEMQRIVGENFKVQNQDEQHASLFRAIQIEKLFVFITLTLIIAIASFNIYFSLSMLAIEKKADVATLLAMGAWPGLIRRIFLAEGALVGFSGAIVGLVLGVALCWAQEEYGFAKMQLVGSLVDAYPVRMQIQDLIGTVIALIIITLAASWMPAQKAARQEL